MIRYDKRTRALAVCLSALAGCVDAIGFIELGGFFVSFMSGNSTRLGVGLSANAPDAALAGGLVALFVLGVIGGSLTGHFASVRRRPAVLALVSALLTLAAGASSANLVTVAVICMALAMGAENAVFERDGEVTVGLTYMTGTLVRLGQRLTSAFVGGDRLTWMPHLVLWLGLVLGAVAGAIAHARFGLESLWIAAGGASLATVAALWIADDSASER